MKSIYWVTCIVMGLLGGLVFRDAAVSAPFFAAAFVIAAMGNTKKAE